MVPGLAEQITELFFPTLTSTTRLAGLNETTLYVVWPNGNDFGKDHTASPFLVAERVISSVDLIRTRVPSAKHFVLFHLSDISQMPYVTSMDEQSIPGHPGAAEVLGKALLVVSAFFDMFLDELAKNYEHNHPGVVLSIFPADKLLKYLHTDAGMALAGIKETKEPCIKYHFENGTTIFTNICDNPNGKFDTTNLDGKNIYLIISHSITDRLLVLGLVSSDDRNSCNSGRGRPKIS